MFAIDSYHDVLSENRHRGHMIGSAWLVAAAVLAVMIVVFA